MSIRSHDHETFYWHDYETFGTDPRRDRPVQFAGLRTDLDFNVVDDPLVIYCKPAADCLPHPDACVITGITPQFARQKGICEAEFIRLIHEQLAEPNTCTLGYNSIRFDDEVTRNCLYRNFYDPYAREWQNGNSRWDLIDVVRAARALRPEGINWPDNEQGGPSFRLDQLTQANNIAHEAAHDALSDVYATIAITKLVKQAQPKLYEFLFRSRVKAGALNLLKLGSFKPLVHVSGKYPAIKNCLAIIVAICKHPTNNNGVIVYDLSVDPEPMLSLSVVEIQKRIFTATADLSEGEARIPLKTVHINKCPVLAPLSVIRSEDKLRLNLDVDLCISNSNKIKASIGLGEKLAAIFGGQNYTELDGDKVLLNQTDPDLRIYSGGFFSEHDKKLMSNIRRALPGQLAAVDFSFNDQRLPEMLFRYRGRNYPETLSLDELDRWKTFCSNKLRDRKLGGGILLDEYICRLEELRSTGQENIQVLDDLVNYVQDEMAMIPKLSSKND